MENACSLCMNLVHKHAPHPALKKISELKGSELYKCSCCYAYLHKHNNDWEIISGGDTQQAAMKNRSPISRPTATTSDDSLNNSDLQASTAN